MNIDVFIVDAFADKPLSGNPAAVCPLTSWLPPETMQAIAAELNQSETVFFVPEDDGFRIRWFTPTREVDHIGHATLAAGHLILSRLNTMLDAVRFRTGDDYMLVLRDGDGVTLDMAALPPVPSIVTEAIVAALGATPKKALAAKHHLFVFDHPQDIAALNPDMAAIAKLDLPAVIVTAPGGEGSDFVSRFFAPANGVPEDSVSGVSHCCLAPYWAKRLGRSRLIGRQLSTRGGIVVCEDRGQRVVLGGKATISLEGTLHLPGAKSV
ncbi:isomerase [Hyphomicrobium methylovorum]|uniref:PhzF family phenazine biosynthesis protein n=1 Tax=Hyphomicrobium methylovorum TaxID=84 RepID=UPI0015E79291|nr:PhzF family phenazine biosynthesis protein [Hyphomicrobium methylovorum]MBA2127462.1 isomerase [Hyphomicrobium methylovorum]